MIPIYMQIRNYITGRIESGTLKIGDKIPTENELSNLFNVSRMTVRHAINKLAEDGVLVKFVGKGTFVTSEKMHTKLSVLKSFSEEIKESGHKPSAKLLSKELIDPTEKLIRKLRINANTKILKVTRIRYVDDLEMSITMSYFPLLKALALREVDMSATSLYAEIEGRLGLRIIKAEENISACLADQKTANLLRINHKSALLKLSRLTIINNNVPVEYMEGLFRPDRYAIYKELFR